MVSAKVTCKAHQDHRQREWASEKEVTNPESQQKYTLPKTNIAPEDTVGPWKRRFLLETNIFRGYVSFREGIVCLWKKEGKRWKTIFFYLQNVTSILNFAGGFFNLQFAELNFNIYIIDIDIYYIINDFISTSPPGNTCHRILLHLFFPATESWTLPHYYFKMMLFKLVFFWPFHGFSCFHDHPGRFSFSTDRRNFKVLGIVLGICFFCWLVLFRLNLCVWISWLVMFVRR